MFVRGCEALNIACLRLTTWCNLGLPYRTVILSLESSVILEITRVEKWSQRAKSPKTAEKKSF